MPRSVERVNYDASEPITVTSTAVGFTTAKVGPNRTHAMVTVETDQVRFWATGDTPTSTEGHLLNAGDTLLLDSQDQLQSVLFIRVTTDATIQCSFGLGSQG